MDGETLRQLGFEKGSSVSKRQEMQRFIRFFKDETGEREVDMHKVAEFAAQKGWPLPKPTSAIDLLAKQFTDAARDEIKYDATTDKPYRVYHAVPVAGPQSSLFVYVDIDEAPRPVMLKSLVNRREQMVSDGVQLTFDMEHWNRVNSDKEPIALPMDLTFDIEWRKNAEDDDAAD
jgi:hypothetical protein